MQPRSMDTINGIVGVIQQAIHNGEYTKALAWSEYAECFAGVLRIRGKHLEALNLYTEILEAKKTILISDHPGLARTAAATGAPRGSGAEFTEPERAMAPK